MAAIGLGPVVTEQYLQPGVTIGCENSPESTTLTGDWPVLRSVMNDILKDYPDKLVRALHVDKAYHSCTFPYLVLLQ